MVATFTPEKVRDIHARLADVHARLAELYEIFHTQHGERSAVVTALHHRRRAQYFESCSLRATANERQNADNWPKTVATVEDLVTTVDDLVTTVVTDEREEADRKWFAYIDAHGNERTLGACSLCGGTTTCACFEDGGA